MIVYASSLNNHNTDNIPRSVFRFCGFLTGLHSICNPIIYLTMTKNFRRTAVKLLRGKCACVLKETGESEIDEGNGTSSIMLQVQANRNVLP